MENHKQSQWVLVLIGCAKLLKATLLLIIATQLHRLLNPDAADTLQTFVHHLRVDPHNERIHAFIARATGIKESQLREIRLGSYIYAAIFAIEGIGLVLRKRWAEYFTVISTALLLPVEVYEIFHGHHHAVKIIVLMLNIVIVVYLIMRLGNESAPIDRRTSGFPIHPED